jgi:hypothetical protein
MLDIDDFERVRESIIQEEEQSQFDEIIFDEIAALVDAETEAYENKHLIDLTDPNEPCEEAYLKHIKEGL